MDQLACCLTVEEVESPPQLVSPNRKSQAEADCEAIGAITFPPARTSMSPPSVGNSPNSAPAGTPPFWKPRAQAVFAPAV